MTAVRDLWSRFPIRFVWPYLKTRPKAILGTLEHHADHIVYRPPASAPKPDAGWPVLFHLHGARISRRWAALDVNHLAASMERHDEAMLVVAPLDPSGESMWADRFDGGVRPAAHLTEQLIPAIDARNRTDPKRRYLQGFSMGGFGSQAIGRRAPESFAALVTWDGALHDWHALTTLRARIARTAFATRDYFERWSPWTADGPGAPVWVVTGELVDYGRRYHAHLIAAGVDATLCETPCGHDFFCMLERTDGELWRFLRMSGG